MNTLTVPRFDAELRISPRPVLILLAISGILVGAYLSMASAGESLSSRGLSFALITWALAAALWFLEDWHPLLGRWATIAALAIVIPWVGQWFALPGFLALLSIPIALTAALISPPAAALATVAQTILVLLMPRYAQQTVGETMAALIDLRKAGALPGTVLYWHTYNAVASRPQFSREDYLRLPPEFHRFCPL
jgi:hypothetical protein